MATHPPFSQLVKHGLRFSLGAALLTGLFGDRGDLLDNYAYPIFGYVSVVIEPSSGRAITAGLGRLGGSALGGFIAATLIYAFGLEGASYYIIPPLTFILTSLICETYRWQAAYSQATLIGTFIAMRAVGTSAQEDIWLYVQSRVIDNWIGVVIGIAVALLFWPQESRTELVKRTRQFLQQVPIVFAAIVDRLSPPNLSSDPSVLLSQLTHLTQTSQKTLAAASTEFQGEAIIEENWNAILSSQTQLTRQLTSLNDLSVNDRSTLATQFIDELNQFKDHLTVTCDHLSVSLTDPDDINSENLVALQQDVAQMQAKLDELRTTGAIFLQEPSGNEQYSVTEVVQCFQLLELCRQLIQSLQTLQSKLHDRMNAAVNQQRHPILTLPKWKPVAYQRVIEIVGMGMAIGMILAIINHIPFPFPSAYAKVASLIVVGGTIFLTQPTRGKAIAMSIAAMLCLYIILFWIYLVGTAFGFNPVSSGLLYFLIYMSCAVLGFTPIARIGAIIAADIFAKDVFPFFEQGLQAAAGSVLAAVVVSLLITHLFMGGSAAAQFTQSLALTYRQLGQLYQSLFDRYLQDQNIDQNINQNASAEIAKLKQILAPTLAKHPLIFKVAGIEQGTSALAAQQKSLWDVWLNHEQQLFSQLGNLEEHMQTPPPDWIKQQFLPELQTIVQQTTDRFNQIAAQITDPVGQSIAQTSLTPQIESLEQQLLNLRSESRNHPLTTLLPFSATFITLKSIAHNLDQITQPN